MQGSPICKKLCERHFLTKPSSPQHFGKRGEGGLKKSTILKKYKMCSKMAKFVMGMRFWCYYVRAIVLRYQHCNVCNSHRKQLLRAFVNFFVNVPCEIFMFETLFIYRKPLNPRKELWCTFSGNAMPISQQAEKCCFRHPFI